MRTPENKLPFPCTILTPVHEIALGTWESTYADSEFKGSYTKQENQNLMFNSQDNSKWCAKASKRKRDPATSNNAVGL